MARKSALLVAGVLLLALLGLALWPGSSRFEPPERLGPPLLVLDGDKASLWLLTKQEEHRTLRRGGGRWSSGLTLSEVRYHFHLQAHDTRSGRPLWRKTLLVLSDKQAGYNRQARLLGRDGDAVWVFLADQPVALSPRDGSVLADRRAIEAANPDLLGLIPSDGDYYTFAGSLVVTTADARQVRLSVPTWRAEPYVVEDADAFRRANFNSTRWNGAFRSTDFVVRHLRTPERWLGLLSVAEAADAGEDGFGDNIKDSSRIHDEGTMARRAFWTAGIGRTKEFSEGSHERLVDPVRLPGSIEYLQGGLMIRPGTSEALALTDPAGVMVLHRSRIDDAGRLLLSRLDEGLSEVWRASLPLENLGNRWDLGDHWLLFGDAPGGEPGPDHSGEYIVGLDLASGRIQSWNIRTGADGNPPLLE